MISLRKVTTLCLLTRIRLSWVWGLVVTYMNDIVHLAPLIHLVAQVISLLVMNHLLWRMNYWRKMWFVWPMIWESAMIVELNLIIVGQSKSLPWIDNDLGIFQRKARNPLSQPRLHLWRMMASLFVRSVRILVIVRKIAQTIKLYPLILVMFKWRILVVVFVLNMLGYLYMVLKRIPFGA